MSTVALALHVARRDLAGNRWIVGAWLIVVVLATLEAVVDAPVPEASAARLFLLPLGALFLAAGIVEVYPPEGAPPGTPVYLRTLPIPIRALLLGRVAAAALLLCGVPLAGQSVALLALDTPASDLPGYLLSSAVPLGGVVLAGLLVGSVTRGVGGAVVLCTGLFILLFPLALMRSVVGPLPGLLPPVPGIGLVVHLGTAGLALWVLALRHSPDSRNWWTRLGAVVMVLAVVWVSQTGLFVSESQARTRSSVPPPQAGVSDLPVDVHDFRLQRTRFGPVGAPSIPGGGEREGMLDEDAQVQISFRLSPGAGVPAPSVLVVHLVTLEDSAGNVLSTPTLSGIGPVLVRTDSTSTLSGFSTLVQVPIPQHDLEGLRSGALALVIHGQGLGLEWASPVELPLESGARFTRGGNRIVVEEASDAWIEVRWSAFDHPRIARRAPGPAGAARLGFLRSNLMEVELLGPSGEEGRFLSPRGSSQGSLAYDLVVAGPMRGSSTVTFEAPGPPPLTARLRIHTLEPTEATPFRMRIAVEYWERDIR